MVGSKRERGSLRTLRIRWQRLVSNGQTCPRCGLTGGEIEKAVSILKRALAPLGVEVVFEKRELSFAEFRENPLESNRIWIEDHPLEEWLNGKVGQSSCCDVCDPTSVEPLRLKVKPMKQSLRI